MMIMMVVLMMKVVVVTEVVMVISVVYAAIPLSYYQMILARNCNCHPDSKRINLDGYYPPLDNWSSYLEYYYS